VQVPTNSFKDRVRFNPSHFVINSPTPHTSPRSTATSLPLQEESSPLCVLRGIKLCTNFIIQKIVSFQTSLFHFLHFHFRNHACVTLCFPHTNDALFYNTHKSRYNRLLNALVPQLLQFAHFPNLLSLEKRSQILLGDFPRPWCFCCVSQFPLS
jgi:hypothetical protein